MKKEKIRNLTATMNRPVEIGEAQQIVSSMMSGQGNQDGATVL